VFSGALYVYTYANVCIHILERERARAGEGEGEGEGERGREREREREERREGERERPCRASDPQDACGGASQQARRGVVGRSETWRRAACRRCTFRL